MGGWVGGWVCAAVIGQIVTMESGICGRPNVGYISCKVNVIA